MILEEIKKVAVQEWNFALTNEARTWGIINGLVNELIALENRIKKIEFRLKAHEEHIEG